MTRAGIAGLALTVALVLVIVVLAVGYRVLDRGVGPAVLPSSTVSPSTPPAQRPDAPEETAPDLLFGRVTTVTGVVYEGRLRFGGDEEAAWDDFFNGSKRDNPWAVHVPPERLPTRRHPVRFFGFTIGHREGPIDLVRPFMARLGDIERVEARRTDVRVTLKSGTAFDLDRFGPGDFDDGVRVWDRRRGIVDVESLLIRTIELLPGPSSGAAPTRLHGVVRTSQGDFSGFVHWDRDAGLGSDLVAGAAAGETGVRFDSVRSIARRPSDGAVVTSLEGGEIALEDSRRVGEGNRGIYVDDPRYGRVGIAWDAFERVDFDAGGRGPAYDEFPPGRPLSGSVTKRDGDRLSGRLVFDLDESETTETLDAPSGGVSFSVPFGRIASIEPPAGEERDASRATVTLRDGERLRLESAGDLGEGNAGMLIFVEGRPTPTYVPWTNVARVDLRDPEADRAP